MKIDLRNIPKSDLRADFLLAVSESDRLSEAFLPETKPIHCQIEINKSFDKFLFKGYFKANLIKDCDRCLEPAEIHLNCEFELILIVDQENNNRDKGENHEFTLSEVDAEILEDYEIEPSKYFIDQILLELPYVSYCKESCKGLCGRCGANLNITTCACAENMNADSNPFSVLKSIIKK